MLMVYFRDVHVCTYLNFSSGLKLLRGVLQPKGMFFNRFAALAFILKHQLCSVVTA